MTFEVKQIEFECSDWESNVSTKKIIDKFARTATKYVPTFASITEKKCEVDKVSLKFKKAISLNTIINILSQMDKKYSDIKFEEFEYKPEEKKVEVEVK